MTTTDCPPLPVRITKSLLGYGVIAGPIYVVVAAAQALTREGYDPTRHAVSQLSNGALGWIQIANFRGHRRDDDRGRGRCATGAGAWTAVGRRVRSARGVRRGRPGRGLLPRRPVGRISAWHACRGRRGQLARDGPFRGGGAGLRLPCRRVLRDGVVVRPPRRGVLGVVLAHHRPGVRRAASSRCRPEPVAPQRFWCSPRRSYWSGHGWPRCRSSSTGRWDRRRRARMRIGTTNDGSSRPARIDFKP